MTKKAVILLSGGLDSATSAFIARKDIGKRGELHALSFDYGQRHKRELQCAQLLGTALEVESHTFIKLDLGLLVSTALTNRDIEVPSQGVTEEIPSTWVPQRNSVFLAMGFALAEDVDADSVYTGFNAVDYSGYPDCRPEFVERIELGLNFASKRFVTTGRGFSIVTPVMYMTKAETVFSGAKLEVPFELTWSCYKGEDKACGVCDSCRIRLKAFEECGMEDPLEYVR